MKAWPVRLVKKEPDSTKLPFWYRYIRCMLLGKEANWLVSAMDWNTLFFIYLYFHNKKVHLLENSVSHWNIFSVTMKKQLNHF